MENGNTDHRIDGSKQAKRLQIFICDLREGKVKADPQCEEKGNIYRDRIIQDH